MLNNTVQGEIREIQSCASKPPENEAEPKCAIGGQKNLKIKKGTSLEVLFNCKHGNENITHDKYNVHDEWLKHSTQVSFRSDYCDWLDINSTMFHDHSGLSKLKNGLRLNTTSRRI